jgi:hypothetical protein
MALALCMAGLASADHLPNTLIVTITDTPDPAATLGTITYAVNVKNSGPNKVTSMTVVSILPAPPTGPTLVKCSPSCTVTTGTVTTLSSFFASVSSNQTVKQSVVVTAPDTATTLPITLDASATASGAHKGNTSQSTTVAGDTAAAVLLPSMTTTAVGCEKSLDSAFFGSDTTVQLTEHLGCAQTAFGLSINASGVTLDLNGKKIVADAGDTNPGKVGVIIEGGAIDVTIDGGGTNGTSGIEYFDWCIRDEGTNAGLLIDQVRCFRARSAGITTTSDDVTIANSLVDNTIPAAGNTEDLLAGGKGGVGIRAQGRNVRIKDTVVRRSQVVGIWASGLGTPGGPSMVSIDGNTSSMRVETNYGIGIRLEGGPHVVKTMTVTGEGYNTGTSTDGVVVEQSGVNNVMDGVVVKNHRGNGFVIHGSQTLIERSGVDLVGLDGYVSMSTATATVLNGNSSKPKGNGYVIEGPQSLLSNNRAEIAGKNGYVIKNTADKATLSGNSAKSNKAIGYLVEGPNAYLETNGAEANTGHGFHVTGSNNSFNSNTSKSNKGIGFNVTGTGNQFQTNGAQGNVGSEWVIVSGNCDNGANSANGRKITFAPCTGGTFE